MEVLIAAVEAGPHAVSPSIPEWLSLDEAGNGLQFGAWLGDLDVYNQEPWTEVLPFW